ncbi:5'-nucleotidase SurE [hydrothermal vent metagenome]|uniref:5'-nucleotidase n=1 Tax=hydrothermal vent metagenome TaxID=652676 RepID=A0A3B0TFQ2_9ZZZZ
MSHQEKPVGRILLTNDDGIHAPGLVAMEKIAAALSDDVWVVAPETEQSGASHSLTLSEPIRVRKIAARKYAVRGTPTDCVMMAVMQIIDGARPDLVLSGVNRGQNMADDVTYSGTIAGAMEGTLLGIPSIAMSQAFQIHTKDRVPFEVAVDHGPGAVRRLLGAGWDDGVLLNVNFPDIVGAASLDLEVTVQGVRDESSLVIDARTDPRGNEYYWFGFTPSRSMPPDGTDLRAVQDGRISVTPLHLNLTHAASRDTLSAALRKA